MPTTFRAFFAIDLPEELRKTIAADIKSLQTKYTAKQVKWVKPEKLHLTVYFLGNITEKQYISIDSDVKKAIKHIHSFVIKLKGVQLFPSARKAHCLVLVPESLTFIEELAKIIVKSAIACGIEVEDREFRPHITLGRIVDKLQKKNIFVSKSRPTSFTVTEIKLFKSESQPGGSVYTPVAVYSFV